MANKIGFAEPGGFAELLCAFARGSMAADQGRPAGQGDGSRTDRRGQSTFCRGGDVGG